MSDMGTVIFHLAIRDVIVRIATVLAVRRP
jgi:hypothetical protein